MYADPLSTVNDELFFIEVKRSGKYNNGHLESYTATTYKMDLKFNGQYRMMELSRFHFVRECIDDILLVPAVMEKLFQIQTIIQKNLEELYDSLAK
ncbi:hypothetical protein RO3G_16103 [Rhizopus delemar RA 99-880]|uniref:Uncharacterized protein n=1 Tax=Rhizopus delemar (strain RA 99-880 / ATCC MYA-4621 / FGSC 9543 / NRRL 43880) TaxID=246409 RepID=I1CSG2_RHIO9|nr:hypothetical protein RO3G_16103 [Rhizopus delemar RA 99-880]|eukprot:EIE91392.1 hypothetical protein RO3G_16103 [Rhizopus delemar RA 99-880]